MALNLHSHPELARAAQDVDAVPILGREPENSVHYGRGGAANVAVMSKEAKAGARARNESRRRSEAAGQVGQFGREMREQEQKEKEKDKEGKADSDKEGEGKSKNFMAQGFAKLSKAMGAGGK